jgi:glycine hydroxymethyltransferase
MSARARELQAAALARRCLEGCSGPASCTQCQAARIEECVAVDRVKKLFDADYANVRLHSASQAASVVCKALLAGQATVLELNDKRTKRVSDRVAAGAKASRKEIDYGKLSVPATTGKPRMISASYSDACPVLNLSKLRAIADQLGAYLHIDITHVAGPIAAGLYPNPIAIADVVTTATDGTLRGPSGGVILARPNPDVEKKIEATIATEVVQSPHKALIAAKAQAFKEALDADFISYQCQVIANARAMLEVFLARGYRMTGHAGNGASFSIDLSGNGIAGERVARLLKKIRIHVDDPGSCVTADGIRIGASAMTTRGFTVAESVSVASLICDVLSDGDEAFFIAHTRREVDRLCKRFPVVPRCLSTEPYQ